MTSLRKIRVLHGGRARNVLKDRPRHLARVWHRARDRPLGWPGRRARIRRGPPARLRAAAAGVPVSRLFRLGLALCVVIAGLSLLTGPHLILIGLLAASPA
jgi:hypothetical protein